METVFWWCADDAIQLFLQHWNIQYTLLLISLIVRFSNTIINMGSVLSVIETTIHGIVKVILKLITNKCELQRICEKSIHNNIMTINMCKSILKSKKLPNETKLPIKNYNTSFSSSQLVKIIQKIKNTQNNFSMEEKLINCYNDVMIINEVIFDLNKLKNLAFDETDVLHIECLERLWNEMKPNLRRESNNKNNSNNNSNDNNSNIISSSWCELGFQSSNPLSDFRGAGYLSLLQLNHFSRYYNDESKLLLLECNNPNTYIPFAATGINITILVLGLLHERRLHQKLFKILYDKKQEIIILNNNNNNNNNSNSCSSNVDTVANEYTTNIISNSSSSSIQIHYTLMNAINNIYCELFLDLGRTWVKSPAAYSHGVMAFPGIYNEFQKKVRKEYPIL